MANKNPNQKNLKSFSKDDDRASNAGKVGGVKSGEVRREKRSLQQSLQRLLYQKLTPKMKKMYKSMGYDIPPGDDVTHMDLMGASCMVKAMKNGDVKAMMEISKMAGVHTEESKLIIDDKSEPQRTVIELNLGARPKNLGGEPAPIKKESDDD